MNENIGKILVTGSSGMVGTRLCEVLLSQGYEVTGVDWKPNAWSSAINRRTVNVDLRNAADISRNLPTDMDMVVHLAANARVYDLVIKPALAKDNIDTLFNTLEYARKNNVRKFIFASSREVYGNSGKALHSEEESHVSQCESPYTASKLSGEAMVHSYHQCFGIEFIIFRLSNVYGMYDDSDRVIPLFIRQCLRMEDLTIYGKDKLLDFTYIDDAINGVMRGITMFKQASGDTFNLGGGCGVPIMEVAELIRGMLQADCRIKTEPCRIGEVVQYIADISRAQAVLGYCPRTDIKQGISRTVEWSRHHLEQRIMPA